MSIVALTRQDCRQPLRRRRVFILISMLVVVAGVTPLSAQVSTKFRAERDRLMYAGRELQIAKGYTEGQMLEIPLLTPFTGPRPTIQKVLPGGSLAVSVHGDFPVGTKILSERDGVTISNATISTTTYSARLVIPPDEGPGFVRLWAFTPIGVRGPVAVGLVETRYRFELQSPNGYRIRIKPIEQAFTITNNLYGKLKYQAEFYRPGEANPFETTTGYQSFSSNADLADNFIDIAIGQSTTSPEAEMDAITEKMNDPNTTEAERNALMARMAQVQLRLFEGMQAAMQTDPASVNKKQDDFGCAEARLNVKGGGLVEGHIACGKNFSDGMLKVTGTMTQLQ